MSNVVEKYKGLIDRALAEKLNKSNPLYAKVTDAMTYSVAIGGKRIRPCLVMEFASICGGDLNAALYAGCAVEMVHTYSLIHDDLPCMDDDDMRRGMPSCHIKFGEATALLAGDGLLTMAFNTLALIRDLNAEYRSQCVEILSNCAGVHGMIGGQVIDLVSENKNVPIETVITLNALKTSKLLEASAMMGCAVSGAEPEKLEAARLYGYNLGLAFQIVDDILDVIGDEKILGKPIGSDSDKNKANFVSLLGIEKAKQEAEKYTDAAIDALGIFGDAAVDLKELTLSLVSRTY